MHPLSEHAQCLRIACLEFLGSEREQQDGHRHARVGGLEQVAVHEFEVQPVGRSVSAGWPIA
ncbi:MAG TPA: hypothetical protein DC060_04405 [Gemmatimonadetes bacterium]|nr:hypothetical protein [Gemmatimonadota bacterium]